MSKRVYLAALLGVLACYGCSDDSSGSSSGSQVAGKGCTSGSQCPSGVCLENGNCAALVGEGADCNDEKLCKSGLVCNGGKCEVDSSGLGNKPECSEDSECGEDKVCKNGKCKSASNPNACESDSDCGVAEECVSGECKIAEVSHDECQSDADCVDPEHPESLNTTCMPNGVCGHYVNVGDACDDYEAYCQEGSMCLAVCIEQLPENSPCDENDLLHVCNQDEGLMCADSVCRKPRYDIKAGDLCNDSYLFCEAGMTCKDTKCIYLQAEDADCDESTHKICNTGMICKGGKCTPIGDPCSKTSDCTEKDSFCCQSELCGAKGYCIPYDNTVTHDESCRFKTKPGIFEAQVQCRWQPDDGIEAGSKNVEMPPLVGPFGNKDGLKNIVAFYSYSPTVIRFINPENCKTLESIKTAQAGRWSNYPAAADLDGDGLFEFITTDSNGRAAAYKWNASKQAHELWWTASVSSGGPIMVYDLNNDGVPEVIGGTSVVNGQTGATIFAGSGGSSNTFAIGLFDHDSKGHASLLKNDGVFKWDDAGKKWVKTLSFSGGGHVAYADFGTPGDKPENFDFTKLDGYPEYVLSGGSKLVMYASHKKADGTLEAQQIMNVTGYTTGGPVTIGDFNNDGLPEVGIASSGLFGVYDPKCKQYEAGKCAGKNVLWERWSQDNSSGATGSSLFDFDGDGQSEAVYADECFTRVYDGKTGKVLFSARRSSGTSVEAPVIADIDGDGSAEILMGSDGYQPCHNDQGQKVAWNAPGNNAVDPIHEGIRCEDDEDCPTSKNCDKTIGFCLCTADTDCNTQYIKNAKGEDILLQQYICTEPIHADIGFMVDADNSGKRKKVKDFGARPDGYKGEYKVCRATRKYPDIGVSDLMIFRDRLDRWVSSRNIWNQHAYNIINIDDSGKVPTAAKWLMNWLAKRTDKINGTEALRPLYNNYRLNSQGQYGAGMAPDITGRFKAGEICGTKKDSEGNQVLGPDGQPIHIISGQLCNRGTKPVAQKLPATFFYYDETAPDHRGKAICTSYTIDTVDVGECGMVGCEVSEEEFKQLEGKTVLMVSNLDEYGFASTVECNTDNNTDTIVIDTCAAEIEIVN